MEIEVRLKSVEPISFSSRILMVLQDASSKTELKLYIGMGEGILLDQLMQLKETGIVAPRPGTYELMRSIAENAGMKPVKVVITELTDGTFYSNIHFEKDGQEIKVDARPSNAVPFAIAADVPLFVEEAVLKAAGKVPIEDHACEECCIPCDEKDADE